MTAQTFIFIGRSGAGKGTQVEWLKKKLNSHPAPAPILHVETGQHFRSFMAQDVYSARLTKEIQTRGDRPPSFIAAWLWADYLIKNFTGTEHVLFDGTPRSIVEAEVLDTALGFYHRQPAPVILLDVSYQCAVARLTARARPDDLAPGGIEKRLAWYETDVVPIIDYYRARPAAYQLHTINGEATEAEVHQAIATALAL